MSKEPRDGKFNRLGHRSHVGGTRRMIRGKRGLEETLDKHAQRIFRNIQRKKRQ